MASSSSLENEKTAADKGKAVERPMSGLESADTDDSLFGPFVDPFPDLSGSRYGPVSGFVSKEEEMKIEDEWYRALYREDSKQLIRLLRKYPNFSLWNWGRVGNSYRSEDGQRKDAHSRPNEPPGQWKGRTALHVGARRGCVQLLRILCEDRSIGSQDLTKLLLLKDGTYGVDAIAMGVVNGNPHVVTVLLEAGYRCDEVKSKYNIQEIRGKNLSEAEEKEEEKNGRYREEIQSITRSIIDMYKENLEFQVLLPGYDRDLDLNFLPREEYLFHFLCTHVREVIQFRPAGVFPPPDRAAVKSMEELRLINQELEMKDRICKQMKIMTRGAAMEDVIYEKMARMADKSSLPDLLEFWWTLKDGQGRPPLHVAMDSGRDFHGQHVWRVLRKLIRIGHLLDEDAVKRIIRCRDGAGRTAVHRAMAAGLRISEELWYCDEGAEWLRQSDDVRLRKMARLVEVAAEEFRSCLETVESDPDNRPCWWSSAGIEYVMDVHSRSRWRSRAGFLYLIDLHSLSKKNGFDDVLWAGLTPIHSVIRLDNKTLHSDILTLMERKGKPSYFDQDATAILPDGRQDLFSAQTTSTKWHQGLRKRIHVDTIGFAALLRETAADSTIFDVLFKFNKEKQVPAKKKHRHMCIPSVALFAARGQYHLLQSSINAKLDPLAEDHMKNTALHYAVQGENIPFKCKMDLLSFPNCHEIELFKHRGNAGNFMKAPLMVPITETDPHFAFKFMDLAYKDKVNENQREKNFVEVQGCINLLIQQGCDIFQSNSSGQVPYPHYLADPKLFSWWHEKQAKEFVAAQSAQNAAANAISVTAALVATASYVGPLQPPLGYSENDPTQLRLDILAVKIFIICDTMSFYLAITAIIFALIPCLPMPKQPMDAELRRMGRMVNAAVTVLFPSIICVLVAFAAGSIAVVQTNQIKWNRGGLVIGTASIGGLICMLAIILFTIRWLRIIFHRNTRINSLYVATAF